MSDCVTSPPSAVQLEGCCCAAAAGVESARQQPSSKGGGGGEAVDACRTGQAAAASLRRRLRAATDAPPFHSAFSPGARERPPLPPFPPPPPRKHGEPRGLPEGGWKDGAGGASQRRLRGWKIGAGHFMQLPAQNPNVFKDTPQSLNNESTSL